MMACCVLFMSRSCLRFCSSWSSSVAFMLILLTSQSVSVTIDANVATSSVYQPSDESNSTTNVSAVAEHDETIRPGFESNTVADSYPEDVNTTWDGLTVEATEEEGENESINASGDYEVYVSTSEVKLQTNQTSTSNITLSGRSTDSVETVLNTGNEDGSFTAASEAVGKTPSSTSASVPTVTRRAVLELTEDPQEVAEVTGGVSTIPTSSRQSAVSRSSDIRTISPSASTSHGAETNISSNITTVQFQATVPPPQTVPQAQNNKSDSSAVTLSTSEKLDLEEKFGASLVALAGLMVLMIAVGLTVLSHNRRQELKIIKNIQRRDEERKKKKATQHPGPAIGLNNPLMTSQPSIGSAGSMTTGAMISTGGAGAGATATHRDIPEIRIIEPSVGSMHNILYDSLTDEFPQNKEPIVAEAQETADNTSLQNFTQTSDHPRANHKTQNEVHEKQIVKTSYNTFQIVST